MVYNPAQPIVIKVEINVGALGWVEITTRGRGASCTIRQGRSPNAIQAETSRLDLEIRNPDGYLTEGNAISPWYPYWGRGCEIRVSRIGLAVSPAERFHGQIDSITERFPGGNVEATVVVTAIGTLGIIGQGDDGQYSPLYRTALGVSRSGVTPFAYWPLEDGGQAQQFGSAVTGIPPMTYSSGATVLATDNTLVGSSPLPSLTEDVNVSAVLLGYTDTGEWTAQVAVKPSAQVSGTAVLSMNTTTGSVTAAINIASLQLVLSVRDMSGTFLFVNSSPIINVQDTWVSVVIQSKFQGSGTDDTITVKALSTSGAVLASIVQNVGPGVHGRALKPFLNSRQGPGSGGVYGHPAVWTDPAFTLGVDDVDYALAMAGWVGDTAAGRMTRMCREAAVAFQLTGSAANTTVMGPQLIDTLAANLRDCEQADQGLMHDNGTAGAIGYVTSTHLYNQTATIAITRGAVEPNFDAVRDNRYIRNDITSRRPNGGSARVADETHVARIRARLKDSRTVNVQTDGQLPDDAAWAVHIGTAPGARYNSVGINLRNTDGALLADQVAAHEIGDRFTVATSALPPQHVDGIDGLTVGWTEMLDEDTWIFRPNVLPYSPYSVGVYDDTVKRYDSRSSTLASGVNSSATTLSVAFDATDVRWVTGSTGPVFPFDIGCEGERIQVTAISGSSSPQTFTVTRSINGVAKSHLAGARVSLWTPAVYAL